VLEGSAGGPFEPLRRVAEDWNGALAPRHLFFGDSVFIRVAGEDTDRRPLGAMLEAATVRHGGGCAVAWSALNLRLYDALHAVLATATAPPEVVVLPINMRSFSPQWFGNPAWQFDAHLPLIRARARDPGAPLGPIDDVRASAGFYDDYDRLALSCPMAPEITTISAFRDVVAHKPVDEPGQRARLRVIMAVHYGYLLTSDHPLFGCLDSLAQRAAALNQAILPVLLPLNMQLGSDVLGPDFRHAVTANVAVVLDRCAALGLTPLDLIDLLPAYAFFHSHSPTEHLREGGRAAVVDAVMNELVAVR
jgi:hypothetical protein